MPKRLRRFFFLFVVAAAVAAAAPPQDPIREAVAAFVATLGEAGREKALMDFESEERLNWHFIPRQRLGLPLKEMSLEEREAAHALLQTALSTKGYLKAAGVMFVEKILQELEDGSPRRDPENYYFSVFGDPDTEEPWGWRVEGHHLSLNYTSADGELAVTPAFIGSNPAQVRSGQYAGFRLLAAEEELGRALMASFTPAQRERALVDVEAPDEIILTPDREARLDEFRGLPVAEMSAAQREIVVDLLHEYTDNMREDVAREQFARIEKAGLENIYFAWAGSLERGERHYYRLHGPTFVVEYDNTQNDANHVHTVWRDAADDFGRDLLREHYEAHPHPHSH